MRILLITLILVLISNSSYSDTIILKNGRRIKVESMRLDGKTVIGKISGGEISFKISEIADVEQSTTKISPKVATKKKSDSKTNMSEARSIALKAYRHAAGNPLNAKARKEALEILSKARAIDANEAEIFLTEAVMILQDGYRDGPWYKARSYNGGVVDTAIYKINNAITSDPNYYRSYTMLAWLYITKSEYSRADNLLEKSYTLKGNTFYYWLYKGTLSQEKKEYDQAQQYYDTALGYATDDKGFRSMIRDRKKEIAKLTGNFDKAERYYLDEIARDPDSAYSYGNYAGFLLCTGRFSESIPYYEKAINIMPYPKVLIGLKIARMGNNEAAKCKNNKVQI